MHLRGSLRLFQVLLYYCVSIVFAGPGGHLELVNLSPYDWELTYQHSYHMDWHPTGLIPAGTKHEQYVEWKHSGGANGDCGAEAIYHLKGTEYEFTVQARQKNGKRLLIEYNDALAALTMTREKVIELGFDHDGSVLFVLSGDGIEPYVSSQAPKNWMQQTLSIIGSKELREISMPMSHNAGMFTVSHHYMGNAHNTVCQTQPIYAQLSFGSRWFDLRPAFAHDKWLTAHASKALGSMVGATGANFVEIINDINRFTEEVPGEFIVLELGHELDAVDSGFGRPLKEGLPPNRWQELYKLLEGIHDLWQPKDSNIPQDLTTLKMSGYIQPGSKSAVIVRIPNGAPLPESGNPAFVHEDRLPWAGDWTSTSNVVILDNDATNRLNAERKSSKSRMFRFPYTISPRLNDMLDIANPLHSIIGESMWAEHKLYQTIWDKLTPNTYPNLIEMDNIHNSQITAISMVINQRYANAPENKNVKREEQRKELIKLSIEDLKFEEFEEKATPEQREELASELASIESSLSDQYNTTLPDTDTEDTNLTSTYTPSTFETQYTNPKPDSSLQTLEPRKGPRRKSDHLWITASHGWNTATVKDWHQGMKVWCTQARYPIVEMTNIATIVMELVGSTQTSVTTMTLSGIDDDVDSYYPRPIPKSSAVTSWSTTYYTTVSGTVPRPAPTTRPVMTLTLKREDWDASITPPGFICSLDGFPFDNNLGGGFRGIGW